MRQLTCIFLFLWAWEFSISFVAGQSDSCEAALAEASEAWSNYLHFAKNLQGTVEGSGRLQGELCRWRNEIKLSPVGALINQKWVNSERDREKQSVQAVNSKYTFELTNEPERGWKLERLFLDPTQSLFARGWTLHEYVLRRNVTPHFTVGGISLPDLIVRPTFKVKKVERIAADEKSLVKVEFEYKHIYEKAVYFNALTGGWLVLDPEHFWHIVKCETRLKFIDGDMKYLEEFTVAIDRNKRPIVKRLRCVGSNPLESEKEEWNEEFELFEARAPETDFTLSAFGLPEPKGITWDHGGSRWYLWLAGCAVASLAAGVVFWQRVQRRKLLATKA